MGSSIRYHRRHSGLTQHDLAEVLGAIGDRQVARYENLRATPSFRLAVAYEIAFRVSIAELFPGAYETVRQGVEERLTEMQDRLEQTRARDRDAAHIARKLEWFKERRRRDPL